MHAIMGSMGDYPSWLWRASWQGSVLILLVLLVQWLFRSHLTPRWRHALWLLVVIRLALPWLPESRVSLFHWFDFGQEQMSGFQPEVAPPTYIENEQGELVPVPSMADAGSWRLWLAGIWLAGAALLPVYLLVTSLPLGLRVRRQRPLTDAATLNLLEDCKQEMGVCTPLTLVETPAVTGPALYGFIRPRLLLPSGFTQQFSLPELRHVFLHELGHVKRGDILLNWLTSALLALHWFNPLVWYAFNRMQSDRELAVDALALSHTREKENHSYGQTIIKLLETFCRPARTPGAVGILENKNQMKRRINMIATFKRSSGWPVSAAALFAGLALVALTDAPSKAQNQTAATSPVDESSPPKIVATSPAIGDTSVDPTIKEITVTFDRDMGTGCSWTGGGPEFPPGIQGKKPLWRSKRTCVLPVRLEAGHYYRVGINSTSFQNFKSAKGVPAQPSAVYFTTRGAGGELKAKTAKPRIVTLTPRNGAKDVDSKLTEIRVTFDVPMSEGCSWTGGGTDFPKIAEGKKYYWTEDHKTCVLPVELQPGKDYALGLNSPSHKNFQSAGGVPLDPVRYSFRTKAE